jgi:hypothetical protein
MVKTVGQSRSGVRTVEEVGRGVLTAPRSLNGRANGVESWTDPNIAQTGAVGTPSWGGHARPTFGKDFGFRRAQL